MVSTASLESGVMLFMNEDKPTMVADDTDSENPKAPRNLTGGNDKGGMPLLPPLACIKTPYFHILGYSVAGEETAVQIPELNVVFDIGKCPRPVLTSDFCLLTHGHMDHSGGLAYYLCAIQTHRRSTSESGGARSLYLPGDRKPQSLP